MSKAIDHVSDSTRLFDNHVAVPVEGLPRGWRLIRVDAAPEGWFAEVENRRGRRRTGRGAHLVDALRNALRANNTYYVPSAQQALATVNNWRAANNADCAPAVADEGQLP